MDAVLADALPLVVIVGPTASGKTQLAIDIAKELGGEIISADSRAIYKGVDIGAAKPNMMERQGVVHWGFDLVGPGERFTVADFQTYANSKITDIRQRGVIPIIAGGTGLYIDSVLFDFEFPPEADATERQKLENLSLEQLHQYCAVNNVQLPENFKNKRYVVNAILRKTHKHKREPEPRANSIIVGITTDRIILKDRITVRAREFIQNGVISEARLLAESYGWDSVAMTGSIYPLVRQHINGEISKAELLSKASAKEWKLAKRQLTWFKRNEHIKWLSLSDAHTYIIHELTRLNNS